MAVQVQQKLLTCRWKVREHLVVDTVGPRGCAVAAFSCSRKFIHAEGGVICFTNPRCKIKRQCFCTIFNNSEVRIIIVKTAHR
jgi:hypothetical protein